MGSNFWKVKNGINLKPISADPSNPVEGDLQYSDGTHRAPGLWQYKATNGWVFVGASGGQRNYFSGQLSSDFTAYANTAAADKPDDFGGSPSGDLAISDSSSTPLRGTTSILVAKSNGSNNQGEGYYFEFSLDQTDIHSVIKFAAQSYTDVDYDDGDIRFYLVFSNDSFSADFKVVEFSAVDLKAGEYGQISTYAQTHASDTDVRFCIHVASTSTSNWNVKFDQEDWLFGPSVRNFSTPEFDPKSSTASLTWTTNTTHTPYESRKGKFLFLEGNVTLAGAPDSATLTITLPYTIDTSVIDTNTDNTIFGEFDYVDGGTRVTNGGKLRYATSTTLTFTINDTDITQASPITWGNTDEINYRIKVPIAGWSSNTQMSDDADQRVVCAQYGRAVVQSIPNNSVTLVDFSTKETDTHGAVTTGGSWKFTAPKFGYYRVDSYVALAADSGWEVEEVCTLYIYKNGANFRYIDVKEMQSSDGSSFEMMVQGSSVIKLEKGDYIDIRIYQNSDGAINTNADVKACYVDILEGVGPSQISATELIAARYDTNAGQTINSGSLTIIDFEDKTFDTHGSVTTGAAWKFIAPATGYYDVKTDIALSVPAGDLDEDEQIELAMYKNGAQYNYQIQYNAIASPTAAVYVGMFGADLIQLDKDDYIDIRINHNIGVSCTLIAGGESNHLCVSRIGI